MTIREALDQADALHPNPFDDAIKLTWLAECEGLIQKTVFKLAQDALWHPELTHREQTRAIFTGNTVSFPDIVDFREGETVTIGDAEAVILGVSFDRLTWTLDRELPEGERDVAIAADRSGDKLMVEWPFDKLYPEYVGARIDYANRDYDAYHNTMTVYNTFLDEFARWFKRIYGGGMVI